MTILDHHAVASALILAVRGEVTFESLSPYPMSECRNEDLLIVRAGPFHLCFHVSDHLPSKLHWAVQTDLGLTSVHFPALATMLPPEYLARLTDALAALKPNHSALMSFVMPDSMMMQTMGGLRTGRTTDGLRLLLGIANGEIPLERHFSSTTADDLDVDGGFFEVMADLNVLKFWTDKGGFDLEHITHANGREGWELKNPWLYLSAEERKAVTAQLRAVLFPKRKIIALLGSSRFKSYFEKTALYTTVAEKATVLGLTVYSKADELTIAPAVAAELMAAHRHRIEIADEVLVVNPEGYMGDGTHEEIAYAKSLGKKVRYLNPVD